MKLSIRMKIFLPVMLLLIAFPVAAWFVFSYALDGHMSYDYNYVLALGILYSSLYIGIMLVVDILYGALDPRIRVSAKGGANE